MLYFYNPFTEFLYFLGYIFRIHHINQLSKGIKINVNYMVKINCSVNFK